MLLNRPAWLFIICFLLPLLLAFFSLKLHWFQQNTTNYGQFLTENIHYQHHERQRKKWTLLYLTHTDCDHLCADHASLIHNAYLSLGKEIEDIHFIQKQKKELADVNPQLIHYQGNNQQALYLIDAHGLVVMQYLLNQQPINHVLAGVKKDLKKLLNYARTKHSHYQQG